MITIEVMSKIISEYDCTNLKHYVVGIPQLIFF